MKAKVMIMVINLIFGSVGLAAGYITNQNFNEMIESSNQEQTQTASLIMSPTTGQRTPAVDYSSKVFTIRDRF